MCARRMRRMWAAKNHTETAWALLHPPSLPWIWLLRATVGLHAGIDALHAVSILASCVLADRLRGLDELYYSLFAEVAYAEDDSPTTTAASSRGEFPQRELLRRILCYWVIAMSLPRAFVCVMPVACLWALVACMYALEAFALMCEFKWRTVSRSEARTAATVSLVMAALCLAAD